MKIDLNPLPEREMLTPLSLTASDVAGLLAAGERPPEGWVELEPLRDIGGRRIGGVDLCILHDAVCDPRSGLVVTRNGKVPGSVAEVLTGGVPEAARRLGARLREGDWQWQPKRVDETGCATAWLGGGSIRNYGHFIFDSLTALSALHAGGITRHAPGLMPRLKTWQTDLCGIAGIGRDDLRMTKRPLTAGVLLFTTAFGHYLHRSDGLLTDLAARLGRPERAPDDGEVIYLSRRGYTGRIMIAEAELEASLLARGVHIVRPEHLSVADQASLMARARVVIGASGAGLANIVFLGPGAHVIEIRPGRLDEPWLEIATANLGLGHSVIGASDDLPARRIPAMAHVRQMPRRLTGRYNYVYEVDFDAVLDEVDRVTLPPTSS